MATELIRHHAVKPRSVNPRNNCARCGDCVRHGDDHLSVHMHGATILFHWPCFLAQMLDGDQRNTKSAAAMPSVPGGSSALNIPLVRERATFRWHPFV